MKQQQESINNRHLAIMAFKQKNYKMVVALPLRCVPLRPLCWQDYKMYALNLEQGPSCKMPPGTYSQANALALSVIMGPENQRCSNY
jgi:hypothetical protein